MEIIQIFALIFATFAMFKVVWKLRDNEINRESAVFWIFIWVLVILIVVFPGTMGYLATLTGVERGVDVIIYVAIIILFYLVYRIYIKMENIEREITLIVREIAVLKRENNKKNKKNKNSKNN